MSFFVIYLLPLVIGFFYLIVAKNFSAKRIVSVIMVALFVTVGLGGLWATFGHILFANKAAGFIGWPAGNPFQFEVGIANLGVGILGLMCIWFRGNFWLATIVMKTVFDWGAAYGHIEQIIKFQNFHPGNAGMVLYTDIFMPILLILFYCIYLLVNKEKK